MSRAADDMLLVDFRDKRVFEQHGLVGFPQPRGEARLEALVKQPADITEIRRAEHHARHVDPVTQPSKRGLCLLRKSVLYRLCFRRLVA